MFNLTAPSFPDHVDTDGNHATTIVLSSFAGSQYRNGPYGALSAPGQSNGETHAISDASLPLEDFRHAVEWVIARNQEIRDALFESLLDHYTEMRELEIECLDDDVDPNVVLPATQTSSELLPLCGLVAIHICGLLKNGEPRFGVELGCNWESEHGAGARFSGLAVEDAGSADCAFVFPEDVD